MNSRPQWLCVLMITVLASLSCAEDHARGNLELSLPAAKSTPAPVQVAQNEPRKEKNVDKESKSEEAPAKDKDALENPFPNRGPAVDLDGGKEWLNTAAPISLKELRGKIVLIDFWTFCCINCIHVLPDLHKLEKKYSKELVVIGVHSAKFDNEKETGNIRKAIQRYEIEHPVVNDADMVIWRKFGVSSWPTLALIDPEGFYCGYVSGEGNLELLDEAIGRLIAYHTAKKTLKTTPIEFDLERNRMAKTPLKFPSKLTVDAAGNRMFISDSNHNRIVVSSLEGKLIDVIGSGAIGARDGNFQEASFDHPQGMALQGNLLYVADTENHLLRVVDLDKKTVKTLAGTGEQARNRDSGGKLRETALNSPWDLCIVNKVLYIAMAGPHQLWLHALGSDLIEVYAGSGREDIINGTLPRAAFAQPSGLVSDGQFLYAADSEGSSIRKVSIVPRESSTEGKVTTVVGTYDLPRGKSLFMFGDQDGKGDQVRLQHPLGLALHGQKLFVADSYNHKVKQIDIKGETAVTWLGTGKSGSALGPAVELSEPAGLVVHGKSLYVADTNNHRILKVDLETKQTVEFKVEGLSPPKASANESTGPGRIVEMGPQVAGGQKGVFRIKFEIPAGYKLNREMPVSYRVALGDAKPGEKNEATVDPKENFARFELPFASAGKTVVAVTLTYGYCREGDSGVCRIDHVTFKIPVTVSTDGDLQEILLTATPSQKP